MEIDTSILTDLIDFDEEITDQNQDHRDRRINSWFEPRYDKNMSLIEKLDVIQQGVKNSELCDDFMEAFGKYLKDVAETLELTETECALLGAYLNDTDKTLGKNDLAKYLGLTSLKVMKYATMLKHLYQRGYLERNTRFNRESYKVSDEALTAMSEGHALVQEKKTDLDPMEFMKRVHADIVNTESEKMELTDLKVDIWALLENNPQLGIVSTIKRYDLDDDSIIVLLILCRQRVIFNQRTICSRDMSDIFKLDGMMIFRALSNNKHELEEKGLLEICVEDSMIGNKETKFRLTEKAETEMLSEYGLEPSKSDWLKMLKRSSDIAPKKLFFNKKNREELGSLKELMREERLQEVAERLKRNNMRPGLTCLLYGGPGTGKTESVLQIARECGRDIMQVDISAMRDKWYGETEKNIKKVFTDYRACRRELKECPILFFNEADAILSVRQTIGDDGGSTDKTENTIQNILLQELEEFEGIMIATTNLTENLDKAFERRFLYKIKFEQPDRETKSNIWRSLLPSLKQEEAEELSEQFDFSGGEIMNIVRKSVITEALHGRECRFEELMGFCGEEKIEKRGARARIGF